VAHSRMYEEHGDCSRALWRLIRLCMGRFADALEISDSSCSARLLMLTCLSI
jgi:hypothetical protein